VTFEEGGRLVAGLDISSETLNYSSSIFFKDVNSSPASLAATKPMPYGIRIGQPVMYLYLYILTPRRMDRCTDIHDGLS
jgi:hypothetical protein